MKKSILIFAGILSFSGISQETHYSYSESYHVKQTYMLIVSSNSRNIEVIAHMKSNVEVFYMVKRKNILLKLRSEQIENGVDNLWKTAINHSENSIKIEVNEQSKITDVNHEQNNISSDKIEIDLKIFVPRQTSSQLHSSDGDILIKGLALDQTCKTNDGNINLTDLTGKISATASDGNIFLDNVTGIVDSHTPDGQVIHLTH